MGLIQIDLCLVSGLESKVSSSSSSISLAGNVSFFFGVTRTGDAIHGGLGIRGGGVTDRSRSSSSMSLPCAESSPESSSGDDRALIGNRLITSSSR